MRSIILAVLLACAPALAAEPRQSLDNGLIKAEFENGALVRLTDAALKQSLDFAGDRGSLTVDGKTLAVPGLNLTGTQRTDHALVSTYDAGIGTLQVVYELRPGWRFVTKHFVLTLPEKSAVRIDAIEVLRADLSAAIVHEHKISNATRGVFLRFGEASQPPKFGAFFALQNPFMKWERKDAQVAMAYAPEMPWQAAWGPFESDRACIGAYGFTGQQVPARGIPEWRYFADPAKALEGRPMLDVEEHQSLVNCVNAFVMAPPQKSVKVHVPWCENDYQIDVGTPAGREEYRRIIDQAAAVGCEHTLFTPENSAVVKRSENTDAWAWENVLWLGLGPAIRRGDFKIETDPIPPSIQEMLDHAKSRNIKLIAYVYPTLGFKQDPEWTRWCDGKTGGYVGADTGIRSFQDWLVDRLVAFQKRTGVGGYCFDHWWIAYDNASSKYAQWYGCRRILQELRRKMPDIVLDGRQQYQWFGPWTWVGGTYPHPTTNDEQPGSFENYPDLHYSRASADRQRWSASWYRIDQFTPLDLVPGYMTHQTQRNNAKFQCVRDEPFRVRDWDVLGWRYSVISSVGTAPFNHVVDYLPARDINEFKAFSEADRAFFRDWMQWTDRNMAILRKLRPILGPPAMGRIDGTAAIDGDHGFIFLFNPNYRRIDADFALDPTIGVTAGDSFALREMYPNPGRLIGKPGGGLYRRGDRVSLPIKGPEAVVLELVPASALPRPALLNVAGNAALNAGALALDNVAGPAGTHQNLCILLPANTQVKTATVNGASRPFRIEGDAAIIPISFAGPKIEHCPQVGGYDPAFSGGAWSTELTIPQRIFDQLQRRQKAWPVPYTEDDLLATWLGSHRLLLFVQIADANDRWTPSLRINGQPVELKRAYSAIYPDARERTFTGFYADISSLKPGVAHRVQVILPVLQPGQFQGLFLENVEAEATSQLQD